LDQGPVEQGRVAGIEPVQGQHHHRFFEPGERAVQAESGQQGGPGFTEFSSSPIAGRPHGGHRGIRLQGSFDHRGQRQPRGVGGLAQGRYQLQPGNHGVFSGLVATTQRAAWAMCSTGRASAAGSAGPLPAAARITREAVTKWNGWRNESSEGIDVKLGGRPGRRQRDSRSGLSQFSGSRAMPPWPRI